MYILYIIYIYTYRCIYMYIYIGRCYCNWVPGGQYIYVYIYIYIYIFLTYVHIYISYTYVCRGSLAKPNESSPFHSSWTQTLLGGLVKRAQLLTNRAQPLWIRWQVLKHGPKALNQTIPYYTHIYIIYYILYIIYYILYIIYYIYSLVCIYVPATSYNITGNKC